MKTNIFLFSVLVLMGLATEKGNCGVIYSFGKEAVKVIGIEIATDKVINTACEIVGTDRLPKNLKEIRKSSRVGESEYATRIREKESRDD